MNFINAGKAETLNEKLPFKHRLVQEYRPKLQDLAKKHPHLAFSLNDTALAANISDVFQKVGFHIHPQPRQDPGMLAQNISQWLKNDYLVLLHYRPVSSDSTLLTLLRAISQKVPSHSLKNLIPVFVMTYSSQKQHNIFKNLGTFGIQYVSFLTPNVAVDSNISDLLEDLKNYADHIKKNAPSIQEICEKNGDKNTDKIKEYKNLVSQGEELMQKEDYEKAIELFSQAISLKPDFEALMDRGDSYYNTKKYVPALQDYRAAYQIKHSAPEPYTKIARCCFTLIKENIKGNDPEKTKKWFALGIRHLKDAKNLVDRMFKENRNSSEPISKAPYADIVETIVYADLREMGLKEEEALLLELARQVINNTDTLDYLDPNIDVETRISQAIFLSRNKEYEKAEKIFRKITDEDISNVGPAFNNFAVELRRNGEVQKAFEIYLELLDHDIPDRDIVLENFKMAGTVYATRLREELKQDLAIAVYENILRNNPRGKEWVLIELSMTYLEMQKQAQASFRFMEAIYINPKIMKAKKFEDYKDLVCLREEMMKKLSECPL